FPLCRAEHEIEAAGEPTRVLRGAYQQLLAEQPILGVLRLAGEIELRGEQAPRWRRDLDVEMTRAALIGAGYDGAEAVAALGIGTHMAAQAEAGIVVVAFGVSLPQVDQRICHGFAIAREHEADQFDRLPGH